MRSKKADSGIHDCKESKSDRQDDKEIQVHRRQDFIDDNPQNKEPRARRLGARKQDDRLKNAAPRALNPAPRSVRRSRPRRLPVWKAVVGRTPSAMPVKCSKTCSGECHQECPADYGLGLCLA